ncbi:MAG TPA: biotin--[acetyl-CoA-carboxylase] ligase [Minicystis sp.]|nr:biotin--[acetyl-CoA-carboxylase] ligase [Minicystis sp.]
MLDVEPDLLAAELARLGERAARPVIVLGETGSTNDDAKAAAAAGGPAGMVFLADAQSRGRGRGGHAWHSPAGQNVYLSLLARPKLDAPRVACASLAVGVAVARAAAALGVAAARIKWPNDVLVADKKLAGVLVEGQLRGARVESLVVGVGLNVLATSFPGDLAARATSLAMLGGATNRAAVAARLVVEIEAALAAFERGGLAPFAAELADRDALLGRRVRAAGIEGEARGIDAAGRLLVRAEGGALREVASGSVELLA